MNLLITGAWAQAKENIEDIEKMGHKVVFMQFEKDDLPCDYSFVEGIICNGLFLYHNIEKFKNLRYIQLTSAGFDRVPMDYVKEHRIEIYNARGVYSVPMAEFAIAGVLQLYKKTDFFRDNQIKHIWEKHRNLLELFGKTVCIAGCGSVGTECAKRFKAFGCLVLGVDMFPRTDINYDKMVGLNEFDATINKADIIVLTVPLTSETKHLINGERLSHFKDGTVLVNISRGGVVDTNALIDTLTRMTGAVLDVFEEEPLPTDSPLWDIDNVILTPHNSFVSENNNARLTVLINEGLKGAV